MPMQVGVVAEGFDSGVSVTAQFDSFMLDVPLEPLLASVSGNDIVLRWLSATGVSLQSTVQLNPTDWQPVSTPPVPSGLYNTIALPMTNAASFFRLVH
jgi:hypothetical protein